MLAGGMNPAAGTQNRLKPVAAPVGNLFPQLWFTNNGFESAAVLNMLYPGLIRV
jgi:hypothetical protein